MYESGWMNLPWLWSEGKSLIPLKHYGKSIMNAMKCKTGGIKKTILALLLPGVLVLVSGYSAPAIPGDADAVILENAAVRLEFEAGTMGLSAMVDKAAGVNHIRPGDEPYMLWQLVFRCGMNEQRLSNTDIACTGHAVSELEDGTQRLTLRWEGIRHWREDNAVTVLVTVDLPREAGIARWEISAENNSTFWGLWEVRFPYFSRFIAPGEYDFAVPAINWGYLRKGVSEEITTRGYPSRNWSMPFLSLSRGVNSIYLAALDPEAWYKTFMLRPGKEFYLTTYVEDMGVPGSDYPGRYAVSAGVYGGDWMKACKMYREWALRQSWARKGPLSARTDVPLSIKELGLWMLSGWEFGNSAAGAATPHQENLPLIFAQKYFEVPVGLHWYNWHKNRFDNEYPYFLPPKPGFRERALELQQNGILVMPYINALISDYDNPNYAEVLLPNAAKDEKRKPYMRTYGTASGRMTPMCVSTDFWQNTIAGLVDSLTGFYGVKAVYLDQLAASSPYFCFDTTHNHPLGGGGWWNAGYHALLEKVQKIADARDVAITTENVCETYIDGVDAFLTWVKPDESEIPMMAAVYSGYSLHFASPAWLDAGDRAFVAAQGRAFLWGCQNGWMGFELFDNPLHREKLEYLKKIGKYRTASHRFLTYGELMDMIEPSRPVNTITETWRTHAGEHKTATLPSVMGTIWKSNDGALGVFICNFLNEPSTYAYELNTAQYGLTAEGGDQLRIRRITPEEKTVIGYAVTNRLARIEHLGPREILALEVERIRE